LACSDVLMRRQTVPWLPWTRHESWRRGADAG